MLFNCTEDQILLYFMHCRLSDVVKGTAKPKSTNSKEKDNGAVVCTSPRPTSPASPIAKTASVPDMKPQQPPPPSQQPSQVPLSVQAQSSAMSCDREAKDGTSSDPSLHTVSQTPPSSPDKYACLCLQQRHIVSFTAERNL